MAAFAVLADIHANLQALRAVLARLDELGVGTILHAGDLVGYGASPAECVALARERDFIGVQGNHDAQVASPRDPAMRDEAAAALDWAEARLPPEAIRWLAELPSERSVELPGHPLGKALLVHGALTGRDDYIVRAADLADNQARLMLRPEPIAFFGHTHLPLAVVAGKPYTKFHEARTVALATGDKALANPGAVGQPRDGSPKASFLYVPADGKSLRYERVNYDLAGAMRAVEAAGLPPALARRLALGR